MTDKLNIVIADDDPGAVVLLKELCRSISGISAPAVARSKQMLMAKVNHAVPDLILLSLTPGMGGLESVDEIRGLSPESNVIITYDPLGHDSGLLVKALEMGVTECMEKPSDIHSRQFNDFRLHLLTITGLLSSRKRFAGKPRANFKNRFFMRPEKAVETVPRPHPQMGKVEVVAIASSTGGPEILSRIFSILPGNLKVPVLLVQHIPADMTEYFARSLNEKSELEIVQAGHGDEIRPSKVYLAPGGQHMTVSKRSADGKRTIRLNSHPPVNSVRPSADVLFESIAKSYQGNVLAVILTGMGEDGKKGVAALKQNGCICISQKAETCVVYGMPRVVDEAGLSDEQLDPLSITQKIVMLTQ